VPSSIKRAEEFGDKLQTIFIEVQNHGMDDVLTLGYDKGWMGTNAAWTVERPSFETGSRGIPNFVLLSSEGKVLLKGNPNSMHSAIEDAILEDIEANSKGPSDAPKSVRKVYSEFNKGKFAKAIAAAQKLVAKGGDDSSAAEEAIGYFGTRIDADLKRASWMIENGHMLNAEESLKSMTKALKGSEHEAAAAELLASLDSEENKAEYDADKAYAKVHLQVNEKGIEDNLKNLNKFVKKFEGTKAAVRAGALISLNQG
jgi:hypothetical protein